VRQKTKSIWGFGFSCPRGFSERLLDALQKQWARGFQNFLNLPFFDVDFVFSGPITKVRHIRTVAKVGPEAAAPANKIFRMQI